MFHAKHTNVVGEDDGSHRSFTTAAFSHQQDLETSCDRVIWLGFNCNDRLSS